MDDEKSFSTVIQRLLQPGKYPILGVTGQAGAGKTTHVTPLVLAEAKQAGFNAQTLGLDAFFILSSRERKAWIEEGKGISPEEGIRRADQINWWDFAKAQEALITLRQGKPLHLTGVYNRADGGELTGEVHIEPSAEGTLVVFEGVAICHLDGISELMFAYAPAPVRLARLAARDQHRKGADVKERFGLTQGFELPYFPQHWHRIT
ncbi:MAG: hypothetical protein WC508_03965, partial [Patescibacteria group bacterium]